MVSIILPLKGIAHYSRFRCFAGLGSEILKQNYATGWYTLNRPGVVHFNRPLTVNVPFGAVFGTGDQRTYPIRLWMELQR